VTGVAPRVWRVAKGDPAYPPSLLDLGRDAPRELFGCGDQGVVRDLELGHTVTIVGSRRASPYGLQVAEQLARLLAEAGLVVVSGMARGIDAAAHRGALASGGVTIAVLGGGPDVVYPTSERRLYREILKRGAIVSEAPPGRRPESWSFPDRNRIMAALGAITVVVEAALRSGSLITVRQAAALNREIGAVPGPVTSRASEGANHLLADGVAPIRGAQDVLDRLLGVGAVHVEPVGVALEPSLERVLELVEQGGRTPDAVAAAGGVAAAQAAVALSRLELLGYLRVDSDGRYARTPLAAPAGDPGRTTTLEA
jgi:DNA processing protein